LKATNTDIAMGKYPISQTPFFKSFGEDSNNGSTIITLLPLNYRNNFRDDSEH